ncbi:N-acetylneuraminate synthase family protein [Spiribacter sp. 221]|uniref:N-acetylneuraminate synthase family protein n=1 Tax=Spiribacter onubensis TaxID=3122420 RepID=UPI00349F9D4C
MKIKNRPVGSANPPLIIAEIGINHGGDLNVAKNMVKHAALAGCECVKHQTHMVEDEMTEEARRIIPPNASETIWDIMDQCSLTAEEEVELKTYAEQLGLIYLSTPFSRKAADFLNEIGVAAFKIGSGECDNIPLIRHICRFKRPIIMSTGMHSIDSLRTSVAEIESHDIPYALLECTNLYPSPPENVSLLGIQELRGAFPNARIGFSDHSIGPEMAFAALGLGASIVERHFTDSRYRKGPDIPCSMDPAELRLLVDRSREIHKALRFPKRRTPEEESVYRFARSSIVAERTLDAGHVIREEDIWARRPGTGEIPGSAFDQVIGRRLARAVAPNQQLEWADLK